MRARCTGALSSATTEPESGFTRSGIAMQTIDVICDVARRVFPQKTATNLSAISGTCERGVRAWLARRAGLSADALANILRSEHGLEFLEAIVGDAKPVWYRQFRRRVKAAQLEAKMTKLGKELDAVRRGDQEA